MLHYNRLYLLFIVCALSALGLKAMDSPQDDPGQTRLSFCKPSCRDFLHQNSPHELIKHIVTTHPKRFMGKVVRMCSLTQNQENSLCTSCINSFSALAFIFLTVDKAKDFIEKGMWFVDSREIRLLDGYEYTYKNDILSGALNCAIEEYGYEKFYGLKAEKRELLLEQFMQEIEKDFDEMVRPELKKIESSDISLESKLRNMNVYFSSANINLNGVVVRKLRSKILENNAKVNNDLSFVYFIRIDNKNESVSHALVIVQHLENKEVEFRLYQSWINSFTLADHIKTNKKAWSMAELEKFLSRLDETYCPKERFSRINLKDCFGVDIMRQPILSFADWTLKGLVLSFFVFDFKPSDCAPNVQEFLAVSKTKPRF